MTLAVKDARSGAVALLRAVLTEGRQMLDLTGEAGPLEPLSPSDRARAQRLTLTTLRNMGRADAVLKRHMRRRPHDAVEIVLQLATVELLEDRAAAHGVVNSAVNILKADRQTAKFAALANAVLRQVAETEPEDWADLPAQKMPGWLRGRVEGQFGRKIVEAIEAAHAAGAPLDLTPKSGDAADLAARVGGQALPTGSVRITQNVQVTDLPGFDTGDWWVQDAAAAIPARVLDPTEGQRALDLCAAPGGKTLQLAAMGARVTALDVSDRRLERLSENLARTGLTAEIVVADALKWHSPEPFDAILLDAPCSATGTIRRHPDLPYVRRKEDIRPLAELQAGLIDAALAQLKPGGVLVYCTCSLLTAEGEDQITAALGRHPGLTGDPITADWVLPEWRAGDHALRLRPDFWADHGGMDGFFVARLLKSR